METYALSSARATEETLGDLTVIARRYNEASLLPLNDGRQLTVMWSDEGGYLARTVSDDKGYH